MTAHACLTDQIQGAPVRQVAALAWRLAARGAEVLLVTSRISGHWLLPKGWPMEGKSAAGAAMQEAYEEAGVWGKSHDGPVGTYGYRKILKNGSELDCIVDVFAIGTVRLLADWPEKAQRRRGWFSFSEAAEMVMEPGLAGFLRQCDDQFVASHFQAPHGVALTHGVRPPILKARKVTMISAAQCRAARALIDWSVDRLVEATGLSAEQIAAFEQGGDITPETGAQITQALEEGGAMFVREGRGRGAGVRLKFGRQTTKRIDIWENEGGQAAEDDIR